MSLWEMVCFAQGWDIETDFGKAMSFVCRIANIKINRKKTRTDRRKNCLYSENGSKRKTTRI